MSCEGQGCLPPICRKRVSEEVSDPGIAALAGLAGIKSGRAGHAAMDPVRTLGAVLAEALIKATYGCHSHADTIVQAEASRVLSSKAEAPSDETTMANNRKNMAFIVEILTRSH